MPKIVKNLRNPSQYWIQLDDANGLPWLTSDNRMEFYALEEAQNLLKEQDFSLPADCRTSGIHLDSAIMEAILKYLDALEKASAIDSKRILSKVGIEYYVPPRSSSFWASSCFISAQTC